MNPRERRIRDLVIEARKKIRLDKIDYISLWWALLDTSKQLNPYLTHETHQSYASAARNILLTEKTEVQKIEVIRTPRE